MASQYPGLLVTPGDKHQAFYQGLLNVAGNMGGYSDKPMSLMSQIGKGSQAFGKGYQGAINITKQDQLANMQAQSQQAQMEAQRMKIEQMKEQKAEEERQRLLAERFGNAQVMGTEGPTVAAAEQMDAMDPLTLWQMQNDPQAFMQGQVTTKAADVSRAADLETYKEEQKFKAFKPEVDKYGTPYVLADPASSTGYSKVRINQAGDEENLGEAPPPRQMFDPDLYKNKAQYEGVTGRYNKATAQINEADTMLSDVEQMMSLVDRVDSGSLADTKLSLMKFAAAFGYEGDMSEIADAETMKSKGMGFVLGLIQKTKGAISEREMAAFKEASAGLGNTPLGNRMILDLSKKVADRMKAEAEAVREAYDRTPNISIKKLDDVRLKARKDFGSMAVERPGDSTVGGVNPAGVPDWVWSNMSAEDKALWQN